MTPLNQLDQGQRIKLPGNRTATFQQLYGPAGGEDCIVVTDCRTATGEPVALFRTVVHVPALEVEVLND